MTEGPTYQKGRQHPLIRMSNRFGAFLDRCNIRLPLTNLDEDDLFRTAIRSTGLQDFGCDFFREPFRVLLESSKSEGHMTWTGRESARNVLLGGLKNRLWTRESIKRFPEILEQPVRRPLIVVGAPRTGTTLMNHLLALDPAARPLYLWESTSPVPWQYRRHVKRDPRRLRSFVNIWLAKKIVPGIGIAHDFGHNVPDECQWLFWPTFVWPPAMVLPTYREWLKSQPESTYDKVYAEYRRAIQMLHWQRPAEGHWVLKSPLHAWALPSLMKAVPEASVIQTHRHMRDVIPSFCSLGAILASMYTDDIEAAKVGPYAMDFARDSVERIIRSRESIDANRLFDVTYANLAADPIGTVRRIYDKFGYEFTPEYEERLKRFLVEKDPSKRPKHVYSMEQFSLDGRAIDETFEAYHRRFGVIS